MHQENACPPSLIHKEFHRGKNGVWHQQERKNMKTYYQITSYKKKGISGHDVISTLSAFFARHSPIAVIFLPIGSLFSSSNNAIYGTNNITAEEIYPRAEYCIGKYLLLIQQSKAHTG